MTKFDVLDGKVVMTLSEEEYSKLICYIGTSIETIDSIGGNETLENNLLNMANIVTRGFSVLRNNDHYTIVRNGEILNVPCERMNMDFIKK